MKTVSSRSYILTLYAATVACSCFGQTPAPTAPPPTMVDDQAQGWVWDHMLECDGLGPSVSSAHAGGPGSSGTYIFSGTGLTVYGVPDPMLTVASTIHRTAKLRITIDGVSLGEFAEYTAGQTTNMPLIAVHNLADKTHSLIVEPVAGWAAVSSILVDHTPPKAATVPMDLLTGSKTLPPGVYEVSPRLSPSMGLDVIGASPTDGTGLQLFNYVRQSNQQFRITTTGGGKYVLQPVFAPYSALSLLPATEDGPAHVGIWQYLENPAQIWMLSATPTGYCRISPSNIPDEALTASGVQSGLAIQPYDGSPQQDWEINPAGEGK